MEFCFDLQLFAMMRSNLGATLGRTYGYVSLGSNIAASGVQLEKSDKLITGALSGLDDDIIDYGVTVPGEYYLKITLETKKTNYLGKVVPIQADLSYFGVDLSSSALDVEDIVETFGLEASYYLSNNYSSVLYLPATSNVKSTQLMRADDRGNLAAVNWNSISWGGKVRLDGLIANDTGYLDAAPLLNCTLPAANQRDWSFTAGNVAIGSVFKNLGPNDQVTSSAGVVIFTGAGSVTRYRANAATGGTDSQEIAYSGKGTMVMGTDEQGRLGIFGLENVGQQVTITSRCGKQTSNDGLGEAGKTVTQYKVIRQNGQKVIQRTETDAEGLQTVSYSLGMASENLNLTKLDFGASDIAKSLVTSDFNWTTGGTLSGYFAVTSQRSGQKTATVKAAKTSIGSNKAGNAYICLTLADDGSVGTVRQVHFSKTYGKIIEDNSTDSGSVSAAKFSGRLSIAASSASPLVFNRTGALSATSMNTDGTTLAITSAAAGSELINLADGDSVATVALKVGKSVSLEGAAYTSASGGQLAFQKRSGAVTITKGTISLAAGNGTGPGADIVNVYNGSEVVSFKVTNGSLNLTASTNARGVTTCSVGKLSEGVAFTMDGVTYKKDDASPAKYVYKLPISAAQTIKAESGWTVIGSNGDNIITTAAKGKTFVRSAGGNDTIALGGAADTLAFELSQDGNNVVRGYAAGKDKLVLDGGASTAEALTGLEDGFARQLDTAGANVLIYDDTNGNGIYDYGEGCLKLMGMGKGQAVTINDKLFYFGNGTLGKNKVHTASGAVFTYQHGAYYYGNDSGKNILKLAADSRKYADGNTVEIDMEATDAKGKEYYHGINEVNGKSSVKGVDITAGTTGLRFTGSKFADTVTCGNGRDYIITGLNQGADTVNGFDVNDVIQINGLNAKTIANLKKAGKIDENGFLKQDTLTLGTGSLTVNHDAGVQLQVSGSTIKAVSTLK